ncbi:TetR/AcrR family transcriptional regulator [Streptomyces sp. TRM S81-3]|uniref:TetR/AcrR family transcriptional regulator n=1 Tax=Streptomyces griseicoloratus TaxID=2752516 RepID=A0A926L8H1_9ACTN|nr:ScbR family autoregulator-binding transcription factor [Streptomyces griseicoloratus]MBD0422097.1 TetR/AcrR family transcriptional regulator [Streptomyces griseicoloratus]
MAKQDRAIRTRQTILEAAAVVFERQGYQAATITEILKVAGVTKGALYFHFESKEELALGVFDAQEPPEQVPPQPLKLQELVDTGLWFIHRLRTNLLTRAGVRLSMDQQAHTLDRRGPFLRWREMLLSLLDQARENGELLPHVDTSESADLIMGAFTGIQMVSQTLSDYADLEERYISMQRHVLPSLAVPSVLAALDLSPGRTERITAELAAVQD